MRASAVTHRVIYLNPEGGLAAAWHLRFARVENHEVIALLLKYRCGIFWWSLVEAVGFQPRRLREQGSLPATPRALSEPGRPSKALTSRLCYVLALSWLRRRCHAGRCTTGSPCNWNPAGAETAVISVVIVRTCRGHNSSTLTLAAITRLLADLSHEWTRFTLRTTSASKGSRAGEADMGAQGCIFLVFPVHASKHPQQQSLERLLLFFAKIPWPDHGIRSCIEHAWSRAISGCRPGQLYKHPEYEHVGGGPKAETAEVVLGSMGEGQAKNEIHCWSWLCCEAVFWIW